MQQIKVSVSDEFFARLESERGARSASAYARELLEADCLSLSPALLARVGVRAQAYEECSSEYVERVLTGALDARAAYEAEHPEAAGVEQDPRDLMPAVREQSGFGAARELGIHAHEIRPEHKRSEAFARMSKIASGKGSIGRGS